MLVCVPVFERTGCGARPGGHRTADWGSAFRSGNRDRRLTRDGAADNMHRHGHTCIISVYYSINGVCARGRGSLRRGPDTGRGRS